MPGERLLFLDNNGYVANTNGATFASQSEVQSLGGSSTGGQFRAVGGNYGVIIRNDGASCFLLQTVNGTPEGTWNGYRPYAWNLSTGAVTIDATGVGTAFGGAITAGSIVGSGLSIGSGAITAGAGTFSGAVSGTSGTFTGAVTGASVSAGVGTLSGATINGGTVNGSTGTFTGQVSALGYNTRTGTTGAFGGNNANIWFDGTHAFLYIDSTNLGSFAYTSDSRIKHQIADAPAGALADVAKLRPVTYRIADVGIHKDDGRTKLGFVTQDVEPVVPSAVTGAGGTDAEGNVQPKSLNPIPLVALLTKAIQELVGRVEALEARI